MNTNWEKIDNLVSTYQMKECDLLFALKSKTWAGDILVGNQCGEEKRMDFFQNGSSFTVFSLSSTGVSKNRNFLLKSSKDDIVTFCDDDMTFLPGYWEKVKKAFKKYPDAEAVRFNCFSTNKNRPIPAIHKNGRISFKNTRAVGVLGFFYKRDFLIRNNLFFDEDLGPGAAIVSGEDVVFNQRLAKTTKKVYQIDEYIASVSQNDSSWFSGYNSSYFIATGFVYSLLFGFASPLAGTYHFLKHHKDYRGVSVKFFLTNFRKGRQIYKKRLLEKTKN